MTNEAGKKGAAATAAPDATGVDDGGERRDKTRHSVPLVMPVKITLKATGENLVCRVDDFSSEGLGIVTRHELAAGTQLVFTTVRQSFALCVAWCRPFGHKQFKCGLRLDEAGKDIGQLFSALVEAKNAG